MARYINGLRMEIQDEMSMLSPRTVEEAYQMALKDEGKLLRKQPAEEEGLSKEKKVKVVEEDLLHLRVKLVVALGSKHLHMVMLEVGEACLEDKEVETEEENFYVSSVTR